MSSSVVSSWTLSFLIAFLASLSGRAEAASLVDLQKTRRSCEETCSSALELTPRMKAWVRRAIPTDAEPEYRLRRLFEMLIRRGGLNLRQDSAHTATASEAFDTRRANCAAFAFLFVVLARDGGIPAYFVSPRQDERTARYGSTRHTERHLAAAYGPISKPMVVDFGGFARGRLGEFNSVSDQTAASIFCSNRGVEELVAGNADSALRWLHAAVRTDGSPAFSWVNLGVALRRAGDFDGAERAYLRALRMSPGLMAARNSLAYLNEIRRQSTVDESPSHRGVR